ncbi:MAG TPA: hypothetical protein VF313_02795 [Anaerolineaceae bacterium]
MSQCASFTFTKYIALGGLVLLLSACAGQSTPIVIPTHVQTAIPDSSMGMGEAAEAWNLLAQRGGLAWSGWGQPLPPLLISKGSDDFLVGHPHPPEGFDLAEGLLIGEQNVFRRPGHLVPVPAATVWNVAGVWSVAVPERTEFQAAVDKALGKGKVIIDPPGYVRAIVHEAFHAYQMTRIGGNPPNFGVDVDEGEMIADLSSRSGLDDRYSAEGQALANALRMTDQADTLKEAARFLQLRQSRRGSNTPEVAAYEQSVEWTEGLARYAEISLIRLAGQTNYRPTLAGLNYPSPDDTWEQFLKDLAQPTLNPDGFRGRYYLLGAGQAFLLDRLLPGWKDRVLDEKQSLEVLLKQVIK